MELGVGSIQCRGLHTLARMRLLRRKPRGGEHPDSQPRNRWRLSPVIVRATARARWLDPKANVSELTALLAPFPADQMEVYWVSTFVNAPRNDGPECLARLRLR